MRRLIIISGAGLSVESGVRAFRTDTASGKALWDDYDLEEVCNIHAFRGNFYHKTHMFYNKRREELKTVEPNLAHLRIGEWYKKYPGQVVNLTTNVDDLIERAGVPHSDILHIHGYLKEVVVAD
ncbi:Sir2 family NAD-dependent protein deacetylase, partial [Enterococcus faecalis]